MRIDNLLTDETVLQELGHRIAQYRISENRTQAWVAKEAGVGARTVERLEKGESVQMLTIVRVLRALNLLPLLNGAVPEPQARPMTLLQKNKTAGRKRASKQKTVAVGGPWQWGDEK